MARDPSPPSPLRLLQAVQTLAGAVESSLAGVNTSNLANGALVYCIANGALYRLDTTSARTADGSLVVAPLAGPGQWLKQPVPSVLKGQITVPLASGVAVDAQASVTAALAGAQVGDVLSLSPTADLPANLAVAWARVSAAGVVTVNMANVGSVSVAAVTPSFDIAAVQALPA